MDKEQIILEIMNEMSKNLTNSQLELLKSVMIIKLKDVKIAPVTDKTQNDKEKENNEKYINLFLSAKEVEGCSSRTVKYYKDTLKHLICTLNKPIKGIQTEDIRKYLSNYKKKAAVVV